MRYSVNHSKAAIPRIPSPPTTDALRQHAVNLDKISALTPRAVPNAAAVALRAAADEIDKLRGIHARILAKIDSMVSRGRESNGGP